MNILNTSFQDNLNQLITFLESDSDILLAYLFGSQANEVTGPLSDIDIALLLRTVAKKDLFSKRLSLLSEFTKIFARDDIDLVILNKAPIVLKYNILKDCKPLYIHDQELHYGCIQKTISEYLDFKPVIEYHYLALQERIEENQYAN
ncbi:MAG: nucleotidyltransferase domain-containing protein [Bacillota bacterium]|nr:nucleotidyltransferase domain-containing protein [Bacillota bacterium]